MSIETPSAPENGESWKDFTDGVRELAEAARNSIRDPMISHATAEAMKSCATTIDEMDHRSSCFEMWLAGVFGAERVAEEIRKFNDFYETLPKRP